MDAKNSSKIWNFWVDRGGTFTDIVACSPEGEQYQEKLLSQQSHAYEDAVVEGIKRILERSGFSTEGRSPVKAELRMGTTVGTNALLERKGSRIGLLLSEGFGDLLAIGTQQRPELFALQLKKPAPLYERVAMLNERILANGEVAQPIQTQQADSILREWRDEGIETIAIALMHAYAYPKHEKEVKAVARDLGFECVFCSHETSPLLQYTTRANTTVLDGYLTPVLHRYISQIHKGLESIGVRPTISIMQSHGGLIAAEQFRGRDSLLSGPAGGLIGATRTAEQSGYPKVITFDMGGTSTDVARYEGRLEREEESEVNHIPVRAPTLGIHTVAAGGGSQLTYFQGRLRVGPESAGADPGPCCYRNGGPLTLTDANLLLGRIQVGSMPRVFGPRGNLPPDKHTVRERFEYFVNEVNVESQQNYTAESLAEGFLEIAVQNMAQAIRKISIQKGYDVRDYTLCCFGGAGGQHACRVADALGIERVFIHPYAGVLSAYGMGLADTRILEQEGLEKIFRAENQHQWEERWQHLEKKVDSSMPKSSGQAATHTEKRLGLKYEGTQTLFEVEADTLEGMQAQFEAMHQQRFGFLMSERPLLVAHVAVEAVIAGASAEKNPAEENESPAAFQRSAPLWQQGRIQWVPLWNRDELFEGVVLYGPIIIAEATGSTVVEAGWQVHVDHHLNLILQRIQHNTDSKSDEQTTTTVAANAHDEKADPLLLEIFNQRFMSIAEQMGYALQRTAHSVNIKERLDFSCALFNAEGSLIANAPHIPVHLGSMDESVKALIRQKQAEFKPGDVYLTNAPSQGGTHLPDITVITPFYLAERDTPAFFFASRGHHADVGGLTPGSMPSTSTTLAEEGQCAEALCMIEAGAFREQVVRDWLTSGPYPARNPEINLADLRAQAAANAQGAAELQTLIQEYGLERVEAYATHMLKNAQSIIQSILSSLQSGKASVEMDGGTRLAVEVRIDKEKEEAVFDFQGTSKQQPNNFNAPRAITQAVVLYVLRCLTHEPIPLNAGCLLPVALDIPKGSLLDPQPDAAVVAGNVETSQHLADLLFEALDIMAGSQGTMNNLTFGNDTFQYYETIGGGSGAGNGFHGANAVQCHMTNTRITDPEVLEVYYPVVLEQFAIRKNSGGNGRFRGGDGLIRKIRALKPLTVSLLTSHRTVPPRGLHGGEHGATGNNSLHRKGETQPIKLKGCELLQLEPDDLIQIETPGGGAWGNV